MAAQDKNQKKDVVKKDAPKKAPAEKNPKASPKKK